jgi:hypothetical protein
MKIMKVAGIALIALGVISLLYGGISQTPGEKAVDVESMKELV